jgi:hypothetical protein
MQKLYVFVEATARAAMQDFVSVDGVCILLAAIARAVFDIRAGLPSRRFTILIGGSQFWDL